MAEDTPIGADDLPIYWQPVPSVTVDVVLGTARAAGLHRIVMGEVVFNSDSGAEVPALRPVCNLVMTNFAAENLLKTLQELLGQTDGQP